ncbi:MAG: succinylglutamate desuccinylase/aspartoacylase family protein [Gammaproteobacteria bacterium]
MSEDIKIAGTSIEPGASSVLQLELPPLYTNTPLTMPVHVIRGKQDGPKLFVSAAIHGDELNGVEIVRRLLKKISVKRLKGTLIAVPAVNIYGMLQHSRYLPDRRDLNRCFPGSLRGSLAGRLAYLFMNEIVSKCTYGIDLHTAALNRNNLPQIRADLSDQNITDLAKAFGVPVIVNAKLRDGSLREAARAKDVQVLVYEAGEAMRFSESGIKAGLDGVLNVMRYVNMIPPIAKVQSIKAVSHVAQSSGWMRAPVSGIFRSRTRLGKEVKKDQVIGYIEDVCDYHNQEEIIAPDDGIIIGQSHIPLVYEGDPLFHIAYFKNVKKVVLSLDEFDADQTT